jgi:energy-coupling factor transporter ATP-binding protein EcfA2
LHITELEIDNFKSFSKKTKIPFLEGFTVISGPNGSGKSNIIDSILFVLALSTARNLRAEKLTDLINLNSGKNTAEVALEFSDGTKVRRRIKRTGNGYYSYNYLNDRVCKQSDIVEHLSRHGIKPHGYNVVMQGDVTRIMEMSDFETRRRSRRCGNWTSSGSGSNARSCSSSSCRKGPAISDANGNMHSSTRNGTRSFCSSSTAALRPSFTTVKRNWARCST